MEGISVVEGVSKAAQSIDLAAGLDERHFKIEEVLIYFYFLGTQVGKWAAQN